MLLTKEILLKLPRLYVQETSRNPTVYAKLFLPGTSWTWYITEGEQEGDDFMMFGYTFGLDDEAELGYISLNELESLKNKMGMKVELDMHFTSDHWYDVEERHRLEHCIK